MFKLALNAGHGNNTPGKRCLKAIDPNETKEYILNKRVCDIIQQKLALYGGIEVLRTDDGSELSISSRAKKANDFNADFYLSIHHNAGINGGSGGGIEVYTYLKASAAAAEWQKELYDALIEKTNLKGNRAQPLRQANFGELRQTKMPAVLCECGFMDSTTDTPIILTEDYAQRVAEACVGVIVGRVGIFLKNPAPPPTAQTAPTVPVQKSVEELAEEVIAGKWGNGAERQGNLTRAGYNYAEIQAEVNQKLSGNKYFAKYSGKSASIVTALKSLKIDSDFSYRKKIANKNGINLYIGSAAQNTKLLNLLKSGKLIKP